MKIFIVLLAFTATTFINSVKAEGNIEMGRALSTQCSACHGTFGISNSEQFPSIAGQKEFYLLNQLLAYKWGERADDIMPVIVGPLSYQEMEDLSAYYASNSPEFDAPTVENATAHYSAETGLLTIPYIIIDDQLYKVEMELISKESLTFSVTELQTR